MLAELMIAALLAVLATASVGGVLVCAFYPRLQQDARLEQRVTSLGPPPAALAGGFDPDSRSRKRSVEAVLERRSPRKESLLARLQQADLPWSVRRYYLTCVGLGLIIAGTLQIASSLGLATSLGFSIAASMLLPHFYVSRRRARRLRRFESEFPNAVDVVVRGIKTGLPVADCLRIVASEAQEPVKSEFRTLVEDHTLGLPLPEAVQRLPARMPLPEAQFFAIVITIQNRAGGSLSEALGNLSRVLRDRVKMRAKIRAMSAEARASAGIIAALPFCVAAIVYVTSPQYIGLLFSETTGHLVLVGCAIWMLLGTVVMRKMINFDF